MGLAEEFHQDMVDIYNKTNEECDYRPNRFLEVVQKMGGLNAAKKFLGSEKPQEGLNKLWELKRLDLSMEVLVLKKKYAELFTNEEKEIARKRLEDLNYFKN